MKIVVRAICAILLLTSSVRAGLPPETVSKLYDEYSPSLVAIKYTWESEIGRRELVTAGVVIGEEGTVLAPITMFDVRIPDEQMKEFKIIVPSMGDEDERELDATFIGRDERSDIAFLKTVEPQKWKPIRFKDAPINVGDPLLSIGLLPEAAGYRPYAVQSSAAALLRGEMRQVLVDAGGLGALGSPVFNADGDAVGLVATQEQFVLLNDPRAISTLANPPRFFVRASEFLPSLSDPPSPGKPLPLPWLGVMQLTGLTKDVAEEFGLKNQPAVEIGDIIPDGPAAKAGLETGDKIVKVNGQPIPRGDLPEELPGILRRMLVRMQVGHEVTLSVLKEKDQPLQDIKVTLGEMPPRANAAKRFYAEDLGFTARGLVFMDTYLRRLPRDADGVVVDLVRPESAAATSNLQRNDLIREINRQPVTDLDQFKQAFQEFRQTSPREAVVLEVLREGQTQVIRIEPPRR